MKAQFVCLASRHEQMESRVPSSQLFDTYVLDLPLSLDASGDNEGLGWDPRSFFMSSDPGDWGLDWWTQSI